MHRRDVAATTKRSSMTTPDLKVPITDRTAALSGSLIALSFLCLRPFPLSRP